MNIKKTKEFEDAILALRSNGHFASIKQWMQINLDELRVSSDIISDDKEIHVSRGARQTICEMLNTIRDVEETHRRAN